MYWKENESTSVVDAHTVHGGNGVIKRHGFFDGISRLPVKFQMWELDPGVSEGSHVHQGERELEEIYYFLEGEGAMWIDGQDVPIAAGDVVLVPPGADHGFRNTGNNPLKLVLIWGKPGD